MTWKRILGVALWLTAATSVLLACCYWLLLPNASDARDVFVRFGTNPSDFVTEDELIDPLLAARGDIVTEVISALPKIAMPKRRYAVAFLGQRGDVRALSILRQTLQDETEVDLLRGDALESIALIEPPEGKRLAMRYRSRTDYLGDIAAEVLRGELPERRSRIRAMINIACFRLGLRI